MSKFEKIDAREKSARAGGFCKDYVIRGTLRVSSLRACVLITFGIFSDVPPEQVGRIEARNRSAAIPIFLYM